MSKYLWVALAMGVAGVAIYLLWKYYQEKEEEEPEEEEFPEVPEEEEPYTPPTPPVDDWETLAAMEYADLHICPICSMSFPSMSACAWHLTDDHGFPSQFVPKHYPRYNKICALVRVWEKSPDNPMVGTEIKFYRVSPSQHVGSPSADAYGCADFIRLDEGEYKFIIEPTATHLGRTIKLNAKLMYKEIETQDISGNKTTISVVTPYLISIQLYRRLPEPEPPLPPPPLPPPPPTEYSNVTILVREKVSSVPPIEGAKIVLYGITDYTASSGYGLITPVPYGTHPCVVSKSGFKTWSGYLIINAENEMARIYLERAW